MSNRYCYLLASGNEMKLHLFPLSKQVAVSVWHIPVAVCTVSNSWWWAERPSETCTVLFQNKEIWETGASGWFTIEISGNRFHCQALMWIKPMNRDNSVGGLGDRDTVFRASGNLSRHHHLAQTGRSPMRRWGPHSRKQKYWMSGVLPPRPCTAYTSMERFALPSGFKAGNWPPDLRQGHSSGDPAVC
jgi:hypothetical protein